MKNTIAAGGNTVVPALRTLVMTICTLSVASCVTGAPPAGQKPRMRAPSPETQRVVFELIKGTLECFPRGQRPAPGVIILVGAFGAPGEPVELYDSESTPGNETAIDCAIARAAQQRSPGSPPSRFVRYRLVFPGSARDIVIDFPTKAPPRRSS
jgi:hypothetical protein